MKENLIILPFKWSREAGAGAVVCSLMLLMIMKHALVGYKQKQNTKIEFYDWNRYAFIIEHNELKYTKIFSIFFSEIDFMKLIQLGSHYLSWNENKTLKFN